MQKYKIISSDTLFICERLKEIDPSYYVLYNFSLGRFEVHSDDQQGSTYCFNAGQSLDERTLVKARQTRSERIDALISQLESENKKLKGGRV